MPELNTNFVTNEVFNAYIENFNNQIAAEKELNDMRMQRIEAILEKALTIMHADNERLENKVEQKFTELQGQINLLDKKIDDNKIYFEEKIEHVTDSLGIAIDGVNTRIDGIEKRIDDMHQTHNKWFTVFGILLAAVPIAVVVIQNFVGK